MSLKRNYYKNNTIISWEMDCMSVHPLAGQGFDLILKGYKKII